MHIPKQQKLALAVMAMVGALLIIFAITLALPLRADVAPAPRVEQFSFDVPTPITTPSSLDALQLTSNLIVGGNGSVAGDLTVTGVITTNGGYIGITPVATATARPHWCGTQNVTGAATVIPATLTAAGVTTPRAPVASLGTDITLDADNITVSNASGVVTLKVWQLRTAATTTPQAATTPVAVNYCVDGN